jgi:hypothetical protein
MNNSFNWDNFYQISLYTYNNNCFKLDSKVNDEMVLAFKRSIVSRCYYSVFNTSLEFSKNILKMENKTVNVHQELLRFLESQISFYKTNNIGIFKDLKNLYTLLMSLRKYRNLCDYETNLKSNLDMLVKDSIQSVSTIKHTIERLRKQIT